MLLWQLIVEIKSVCVCVCLWEEEKKERVLGIEMALVTCIGA